MRTADDWHELTVETDGYFADRDPLTRTLMDWMLTRLSTRKVRGGRRAGRVSERSVERTATALESYVAGDSRVLHAVAASLGATGPTRGPSP